MLQGLYEIRLIQSTRGDKPNMGITFKSTVLKAEGVSATGIPVPDGVVAALGKGKNPRVKVNLNGYQYPGIVQTSDGRFMLSVSAALREAAGVEAGDEVEITLELDLEPRTVEVPDDLRAALSEKAGAMDRFDALAYSKRKEFVRQVEEAKTQETRERRIAKIVAELSNS
jgi:hypothetical protein